MLGISVPKAHTPSSFWTNQAHNKLIVCSPSATSGDYRFGERTPSRHHDRLLSQIRKERTYLVISKLQPFRRSRALFRMMPLSLPGYTFLSEFIGARREGRPEETAISLFSGENVLQKNKRRMSMREEKASSKGKGGSCS